MVSSPNAVLQACRRFWSRESILHESAGEDFNEEEAADEEDGQEMDTTEPMLGATYWANLLGNYAGNLKGAQEGLDRKPSRKRNRTEKAAAAFAGLFPSLIRTHAFLAASILSRGKGHVQTPVIIVVLPDILFGNMNPEIKGLTIAVFSKSACK